MVENTKQTSNNINYVIFIHISTAYLVSKAKKPNSFKYELPAVLVCSVFTFVVCTFVVSLSASSSSGNGGARKDITKCTIFWQTCAQTITKSLTHSSLFNLALDLNDWNTWLSPEQVYASWFIAAVNCDLDLWKFLSDSKSKRQETWPLWDEHVWEWPARSLSDNNLLSPQNAHLMQRLLSQRKLTLWVLPVIAFSKVLFVAFKCIFYCIIGLSCDTPYLLTCVSFGVLII